MEALEIQTAARAHGLKMMWAGGTATADRSYPVNQWQYINNYWYFFNASGYMVTGWVQWNNVWYYCCDSGEMLTNTRTPDGYYVDGNGAWIQ